MEWRRCRAEEGWAICKNASGFQAADLQQGAIGDCWFMSALAVVAQRPDLLLKLLPELAMSSTGRYGVQLFVDGAWEEITIDDHLPFIAGDKQLRADGTGLAYCRGKDRQLWPPLIEKAYAKMYGSYRSISGGEISEALLDLTGFPTQTISFDHPAFSPESTWRKLMQYSQHELPMGCATGVDPNLRQTGLVGMHAYSILECAEMSPSICKNQSEVASLGIGVCPQSGLLRMVRVRNPHGEKGSEWNGMFSDADGSVGWSSELRRTGQQDGTFWMNYRDFLLGFALVDVSMAYRGMHSASFKENLFPIKDKSCQGKRLASCFYELHLSTALDSPGASQEAGNALAPPRELHLLLIQPSKRGSFCRDDRKKSYKPGDAVMFLVKRGGHGRGPPVVVAAGSFDRKRIAHLRYTVPEGDATLELCVMALGSGPAAAGGADSKASKKSRAPFVLRLCGTMPFRVERKESTPTSRVSPSMTEASMLLGALQSQLRVESHQKIPLQGGSMAGGACVDASVHILRTRHAVFVYGSNPSGSSVHVSLTVLAKGMDIRSLQGGIESSTTVR